MSPKQVATILLISVALSAASTNSQPTKEPPTSQPTAEPSGPPALGEGWLGVGLVEIPIEEARALGYEHTLVGTSRVFPNSPAIASGLLTGDVILQFDDTLLTAPSELVALVRSSPPGREVVFTLLREGERLAQPILLGLRPEFENLLSSYFEGNDAPPMAANALNDDSPVDLSAHRGNVVLVEFWATWCGPCVASIPVYNELNSTLTGVEIIAVSNEPVEVLRAFAAERTIDYQIAYDVEGETTSEYWITAYPTLFVIDKWGVVRHVHIGAGHSDELMGEIEVLLAESEPSGDQ